VNYGRATLDFNGTRISGASLFAVCESIEELPLLLRESARRFPSGGAIGFWSYEAARAWEPRAWARFQENEGPRFRLVFFRELVRTPIPIAEGGKYPLEAVPDDDARRAFYTQGVGRIREFIAQGDIYQANLTHRFEVETPHSPRAVYERLRAMGQAPRGALLEWDDFALVSNSPETFLTLRDGVLESKPIKGTLARGRNLEEDETRKTELQNSGKDRAENVMIVDLIRNDLGRVCEFGSVRVPSLWEVETFPTLHHLVSTVRGTLRQGCDALDAFRAAFPCGSITGAPKLRAMQILSELEPVPRGASMGAIGYFAWHDGRVDEMEWSVSIRTATIRGNRATFHAGGGIVADSIASSEYEEMQLKARTLWNALK